MQGIRKMALYRQLITRVVMLYYLLFLLWRGYCHLLPFQLNSPAITKMHYDLSFWFFKLSGLNALLVQNEVVSIVFSILMIVFCILCILFPRKKLLIIPFSIAYFFLAL